MDKKQTATVSQLKQFFWEEKEILRDAYKKKEYGSIILPFVLLRRLDQVLEPTRDKVIKKYEEIKNKDESWINDTLNDITGYALHNKTKHSFNSLIRSDTTIHSDLKLYIRGFSKNIQEIFENFDFENTIKKLHKNELLLLTVQHFEKADVSPERVDEMMMGTIFEEVLRETQEAGNEDAGEHFTPREVIRLMSQIILESDKNKLSKPGMIRSIYDPAVGTGGMLSIGREQILKINPKITVDVFGQELNAESFAICQSDMLLKNLNPENIKLGRKSGSLGKQDGFTNEKFHYMLSNPPYGVKWKKYSGEIIDEAKKGNSGKYGAGLPRQSDGSLLFVMQMLSKMKPVSEDGSRIGIVLNGSPLFTGEAGEGKNESDIRKWIIENDYLEAIIALPDQLFYNTGIFTYIWILTNKKESKRVGKVQLINASSDKFYEDMPTSLGNKRHLMTDEKNIPEILEIYKNFKEGEYCKILENKEFAYNRITVDRPLRRNFQANSERIERIKEQKVFQNIASNKPKPKSPQQKDVISIVKKLPSKLYKDHEEFFNVLKDAFTHENLNASKRLLNAITNALSEKDETANPELDSKNPLGWRPDTSLRDYENIPLTQKIDDYFEKEVTQFVPDAKYDSSNNKIGYEIPFTKIFYVYTPLRTLEEIDSDLLNNQKDILKLQETMIDK